MTLDRNWNQLRDVVYKAMTRLRKQDVKLAEAFLTSSQTTEIAVRNSEIIAQNRIDDSGVGFRVAIAGNKVGFACTNNLAEQAIFEAGDKAFAIAQVSAAFPGFALPSASRPARVQRLFVAELAEMTIEQAVDVAKRAIDAATRVDKRVTAKDGRVVIIDGRRGIVNTLGVDLEERETRAALTLGCIAERQSEVTGSCYASTFARSADLKPEEVGQTAGNMAVNMLGPKPPKSFQGPVIFGPEAVSYQICDVLIDALKAENVVSGRSAWTRKLGKNVASDRLSISDNATLDGGFASRGFDDEGCSSQHTRLLSNGQLDSFLHHATTAKALGQSNTGNASRFSGGFDMAHLIIGEGYRTKPEVYPSNLVIQPGTKTKEALVSELPAGILIESMAGFAQRGSGVVSAQLSRAFVVQDGAVQHPIKGGMVSGVAFEWLKQVTDVSKDATPFQNAIVPSLRVENVKVVGS